MCLDSLESALMDSSYQFAIGRQPVEQPDELFFVVIEKPVCGFRADIVRASVGRGRFGVKIHSVEHVLVARRRKQFVELRQIVTPGRLVPP